MEWSMPPPRCEISPPEKRTKEMKEKSLVGHQNLRPSGVRPRARAAPLSHDDSASHSNLNKMLLVSPRCGRTDGVSGCIGEMRSSGDGDTLQPKTFLPSLSRAARLLSPPSFFSPVPHCPSIRTDRLDRPCGHCGGQSRDDRWPAKFLTSLEAPSLCS